MRSICLWAHGALLMPFLCIVNARRLSLPFLWCLGVCACVCVFVCDAAQSGHSYRLELWWYELVVIFFKLLMNGGERLPRPRCLLLLWPQRSVHPSPAHEGQPCRSASGLTLRRHA